MTETMSRMWEGTIGTCNPGVTPQKNLLDYLQYAAFQQKVHKVVSGMKMKTSLNILKAQMPKITQNTQLEKLSWV